MMINEEISHSSQTMYEQKNIKILSIFVVVVKYNINKIKLHNQKEDRLAYKHNDQ